jgi:hypothetical protein
MIFAKLLARYLRKPSDSCPKLALFPTVPVLFDDRLPIVSHLSQAFDGQELDYVFQGWSESTTAYRKMKVAEGTLRRYATCIARLVGEYVEVLTFSVDLHMRARVFILRLPIVIPMDQHLLSVLVKIEAVPRLGDGEVRPLKVGLQ